MRLVSILALVFAITASAQTTITIQRNSGEAATPQFNFTKVPPPSNSDAATNVSVKLIGGRLDTNSPDVSALVDGIVPSAADQPDANVFFGSNTWGARVRFDLGGIVDIAQINSYSWHPDTRAPQVYKVFGAKGDEPKLILEPSTKYDPAKAGWKFIGFVDTRKKEKLEGGQYGVSIASKKGLLGRYRYLLFDFFETEADDPWGQTFYSEIDVIAKR